MTKAIENNYIDIVNLLIEQKTEINNTDVAIAINNNNIEIVKLLLKDKKNNRYLFDISIENNCIDIVKLLLYNYRNNLSEYDISDLLCFSIKSNKKRNFYVIIRK